MKTEILYLLRESGQFLSGQELCVKFGVSRTAVWKAIRQLREEGYIIEAVQNKGYRLCSDPDVLSESSLKSRIHNKWAGNTIYVYQETGSTNVDAKKLSEEGAPHGTLVVADMQNAGRGRRGRIWQSPPGQAVYFTLLLKPDFTPDKATAITLVMALAVAEAIEELYGKGVAIKWPNDIVVNTRKVCGILTEMSVEPDYIHYIVVGAGINANMESFPEEIQSTATSLFLEYGTTADRAELLQKVLEKFEKYYEVYTITLDLSGLEQQYNKYLANKGKQVRVLDPKGEFEGIALGINASGELLVQTADNSVTEVYAGEVSVRGPYGYI